MFFHSLTFTGPEEELFEHEVEGRGKYLFCHSWRAQCLDSIERVPNFIIKTTNIARIF